MLRLVGADPRSHVAVFTRNTTEALNALAFRAPTPTWPGSSA